MEVIIRKLILYPILFFILFLFVILLASNASPAEPAQKTFTLTINSKDVIVKLPAELPEMDTAIYVGEECFDLKVCRQQFCLNDRLPGHDHVDFVFTDKGEMIALVWIRTREAVYVAWKHVNGIPILSSIDEIKAIIMEGKEFKEI